MQFNRYFGFKEEQTFGTAVSVDKYCDIVDESITPDLGWMVPDTSRSRDFHKAVLGKKAVAGDVHAIAEPENGLGWFLKWLTGGDVTSQQGDSSGVYEHTFALADIIDCFTCEIGVDSDARQITSMLMDRMEFESVKGDFLGLTLGLYGKTEAKASIGTPSFSNLAPFAFACATFKIETVDKSVEVEALRIAYNNNIPYDEMHSHGSEEIVRIEVGGREITGNMDLYFEDADEYDRFLAGTEFELDCAWLGESTGGTPPAGYEYYKLAIVLPRCLYERDTAPHVDRKERKVMKAPFKVLAPTSGDIFQAKLINKVTSYPNA